MLLSCRFLATKRLSARQAAGPGRPGLPQRIVAYRAGPRSANRAPLSSVCARCRCPSGILLATDHYRNEYAHAGVLEFSTDGKTWTKLADLNSAVVNVELPDEPLRALRLRAEKPQRYWLIIREIVLSDGS